MNEKYPLAKLIAEKLEQYVYRDNLTEQNPSIPTLTSPSPLISQCQHAILSLLARGFTYKQVAKDLGISPRTVESHMEKLRKKFNAKTTQQLMTIVGDKRIKVK
ncbi:MAG: helix-turn-helix domain-containing protein [Nitrospinae bacterium]|nr:helix-turn-helix domain-containing protein [Nitrospinota bacterium]